MFTLRNLFFAGLLFLPFPVQAGAIEITISQEQQEYFHHVACTCDSAAIAKILSAATDPGKFSSDIARLTRFSSERHAQAIDAGVKLGKTKQQIEQFIQLQTDQSFRSNTFYITKKGFDNFQKNAVGALFAFCSANKEPQQP